MSPNSRAAASELKTSAHLEDTERGGLGPWWRTPPLMPCTHGLHYHDREPAWGSQRCLHTCPCLVGGLHTCLVRGLHTYLVGCFAHLSLNACQPVSSKLRIKQAANLLILPSFW